MKIENRDIVVIGIQPWDIEIGSNCKDIATEFSKNNRVLYINIPISKRIAKKQPDSQQVKNRLAVIEDPSKALQKIGDNMWTFAPPVFIHSINSLPSTGLFRYFNKINNKKIAAEIRKAIDQLNFKNFILFNDQHMFLGFHLKELLNPNLYIYYIRDNLQNVKYWNKHGKYLEPELIAKADLVFTNSLLYEERAREYNKESYMVGQGCDTSLYRDEKVEIANEMSDLKKPVIGYVGFLSSKRLDIDVIRHIAVSRPDYTVVLVGPEDDTFKNSDLHSIKNVKFLGPKPPETLPSYIKAFDIAINPQRLTKATMGNYPRKIDEYLAMGKATLGTWTRAMEYFKDSVYLAKTKEEYVELIDKALEEDNDELKKKRTQVGHLHSWTTCVNLMYDYITKKTG